MVFQAKSFQVIQGGESLDPVGVFLVCPLVIPEPVLPAVGEDDEGNLDLLGVLSGLLLGVVRVLVLRLGFQDGKRTELAEKEVVRR